MILLQCLLFLLSICKISFSKELELASLDLYNENEAYYDKDTRLVITAKVLPKKIKFLSHLITMNNDYLIANFITNSPGGMSWKWSSNLQKTLQDVGIKNRPSYSKGYYVIVKAKFYTLGKNNLILTLTEYSWPIYKVKVYRTITVKSNLNCSPLLDMPICSNAEDPAKISVSMFIYLHGIIINDCNDTNTKSFKWSAYDIMEKNLVHRFPATTSPHLKVKPFQLRVNLGDDVNRHLLLVLLETVINNTRVRFRCYLKITGGIVMARIVGGSDRKVTNYKTLHLDGSHSIDTSAHISDQKTSLKFKWDCSSRDDPSNRYCKDNFANTGKTQIPPNKLKVGMHYTITMRATSSFDSNNYAEATQNIQVVSTDTLQARIECMDNCFLDIYNPLKNVHLLAVCDDCEKNTNLDYEWYIDGMLVQQSIRMNAHISTIYPTAEVKLVIKDGRGRRSEVEKDFRKNDGPSRGNCYISPKSGYEYLTEFNIKCYNFISEYQPIRYYYITKKVVLDYSISSNEVVALPVTKHISVQICDTFFICAEEIIPVNVKPRKIPMNDLATFLSNEMNLDTMIKIGDANRALVIINAAAAQITNAQQANVILDAFKDFQPDTAIKLGLVANITRTMAERLSPLDNEEIVAITGMLKVVNSNFKTVKDDGEAHNLRFLPYLNITQACVTLLDIITTIQNAMQLPPTYIYDMISNKTMNPKNRLTEEDIKRVEKEILLLDDPNDIANAQRWFNVTVELDTFFHYIDFASSMHLKPDEDRLTIVTESIVMEVQCFYVDDNKFPNGHTITTHDGITIVYFPRNLLIELSRKHLGDRRICLKVISILRNLFWWYPEERQPSRRIVSVRAYTTDVEFKEQYEISTSLEFYTLIGHYRPADIEEKLLTNEIASVKLLPWKVQGSEYIEHFIPQSNEADYEWIWMLEHGINILQFAPLETAKLYKALSESREEITNKQYPDAVDLIKGERKIENKIDSKLESNLQHFVKKDLEKTSNYSNLIANDKSFEKNSKPISPRVVARPSEIASSTSQYHNSLITSTFDVYEKSRIYRVHLDATALLAVRFTDVSHDLRVLLQLNSEPNRLAIAKSNCIVNANKTKIILLRNNCMESRTAYLGVRVYTDNITESCSEVNPEDKIKPIENGPANFSFIFQIRACDYWVYSAEDPHWATDGCTVGMEKDIFRGIHCICKYLSSYTTYAFNVPAIEVPVYSCSFSVVPVNMEVVYFHLLLWPLLFILVILTYVYGSAQTNAIECQLNDKLDASFSQVDGRSQNRELHHLQIYVKTGGHEFAGTTANVKIYFQTEDREEVNFTIYQDPEHPKLKRNSQHTLKLHTPDIAIPTRIALVHDNNGRYPSWYCESIVLEDMVTGQCQIFRVQNWIHSDVLTGVKGRLYHSEDKLPGYPWCQRFRRNIEVNFINWFMFQPLLGEFRISLTKHIWTRFERTCVWVAKFGVTVMITLLYFGRTTVETYEQERTKYSNKTFDLNAIFTCSAMSLIMCVVIDLIYKYGILKYTGYDY